MPDSFSQGGNDPDRYNIIKILRRPVSIRSGAALNNPGYSAVSADFHTRLRQDFCKRWEYFFSDFFVNEDRFSGIAYGNVLCFAVQRNSDSRFRVGEFINIDMSDTVGMAEYGDSAVVHNILNEAAAPPGDNQIDQAILLQHGGNILP